MTEEQAIKNLTEIINLSKEEIAKEDENITATLDLEDLKSLQIALNMLKEKEKEIIKKDKQISLIAEKLSEYMLKTTGTIYPKYEHMTKEEAINHFEREAENER